MTTVDHYRKILEEVNHEIFTSIRKRREIVSHIQLCKISHNHQFDKGFFPCYDPQREKEIFTLYKKDLQDFSCLELLSFSLLVESHASKIQINSYPQWSSKVHLSPSRKESQDNSVVEMMNPLLVKLFLSSETWQQLSSDLHPEFLMVINHND